MLHERECQACARFAAQTRALENRLARAIRIDVPESLAKRIRSNNRIRPENRRWRHTIALAASVLLTLGVGGGIFYFSFSSPPLQAAVKNHIEGEWESLARKDDTNNSSAAAVLSTIGGVLIDHPENVRHASLCDFSEYGSAHLVVDGTQGPVLALILKEKYISKTQFMTMSKPGDTKIEGILVPISNGSMAIVGTPGENLHDVEKTLRDAVFWRI